MTIDLTKKVILRVGGLSLLVLIIVLGIFVPTLSYIKKTAKQSYELRLYLEKKYEQSLRSRITRKKLEEIKKSTTNFESFLFKTGDDLALITFLENLSTKNNVAQSISSPNLDKIGNNRIVTLSIGLSGDYKNILKYLADLESSNYFIYMTQMQFTPTYARSGEILPDTKLSLTAELYVNQ